jgi:predicted FMN-binding regulatory protein PaiB
VQFEADDEEVAALMVLQAAAEQENEDEEPERVEDDPAEFARVEAVYRKERAAIKASSDASDLRLRRQSMESTLNDARQSNIAHTRARDLLGEIEQRELRILAERSGKRGR